MKQGFIISTIYFLLVLLFTYTGFSKLYNHTFFQGQLSTFPLLKNISGVLSWVLPFLELLIAGFLIIPNLRLYGFYCSVALLLLFTVYLTIMIMSGINLPCSCGGVIEYLSWRQHVFFNLFFIAISIAGVYFQKQFYKSKHHAFN